MQWKFQSPINPYLAYEEANSEELIGYLGFFYPKLGAHPAGPTVAWKAYRAGVNDYRYIVTLQKALAAARTSAPDVAREIEEKFEQLKGALKDGRRLRAQGGWSGQGVDEQNRRYISGVFNIDNGWNLDDYDKARETIAGWITRLRQEPATPAAP